MTYRRSALLLAVPLLALAACADKDTGSEAPAPTAAPVAAVAAPAGKMWAEVVAPTPAGGMLMGNPNAPIKLLEYGSLSCPHCARLAQEGMQALTDKYVNSGRVSYEFRSFPIHPQDVPLTLLAQCAGPQTFFPLVEQIYTNFDAMNAPMQDQAVMARAEAASRLPANQRLVGLSNALQYTDFFAARGISTDQANACLTNDAAAEKVANQGQQWAAEGINSTPTLVINGRKIDGATWAELEPALQQAGAR
jgi:protein-disulfide isomerase